jgi:hypothetical protein
MSLAMHLTDLLMHYVKSHLMSWRQIRVPSTILWNASVVRIAAILTFLLVKSCNSL